MRSVEQAIGLMKNLQTSIVVEETWVEKQTEKLQSLPTATSARELDVSSQKLFAINFCFHQNVAVQLFLLLFIRLSADRVESEIIYLFIN